MNYKKIAFLFYHFTHIDTNFADIYKDYKDTKNCFYAFDNQKRKCSHDSSETDYGDIWYDGDIVKLELNTVNKSLSLHINDENYGVGFDNIYFNHTTYYLAISFFGKFCKGEIQLIEFNQKRIT